MVCLGQHVEQLGAGHAAAITPRDESIGRPDHRARPHRRCCVWRSSVQGARRATTLAGSTTSDRPMGEPLVSRRQRPGRQVQALAREKTAGDAHNHRRPMDSDQAKACTMTGQRSRRRPARPPAPAPPAPASANPAHSATTNRPDRRPARSPTRRGNRTATRWPTGRARYSCPRF